MDILLVSHRGIASGIKSTVEMVLGNSDQIKVIELTEEGVEKYTGELEAYLTSWLTGEKKGIIFADIKGGTPFNQAELLLKKYHLKHKAKVISGVNLPMIVDLICRDADVEDPQEIKRIMANGKDGISCLDLMEQTASSEDE